MQGGTYSSRRHQSGDDVVYHDDGDGDACPSPQLWSVAEVATAAGNIRAVAADRLWVRGEGAGSSTLAAAARRRGWGILVPDTFLSCCFIINL